MSNNKESLDHLIHSWQTEPTIRENIYEWRTIPSRQPSTILDLGLPSSIHPRLRRSLQENGITSLYSHQKISWQLIQEGKNIIVVSGTSSGKSLCYQLPVLNKIVKSPKTTALFLFPTKALAQDQNNSLLKLIKRITLSTPQKKISPTNHPSDIAIALYDGDTPQRARQKIRQTTNIIFSNPDMLHIGILPHHTSWQNFFSHLAFVVLDEAHTYRGVFGSHVANIIRRLKRITHLYGSNPQFIMTSATIANPDDFSSLLIGDEVICVDQDDSIRGQKHFLIYNPPIIDERLGLRSSALQESVRLAKDLLTNQVQTIIFARSRRSVELILTYLREESQFIHLSHDITNKSETTLEKKIRGYRSGYLASQRREIEQALRTGEVRAVVATNALELGIDIGSLGAALLVGYPGSIAATWQQSGRAGRGEQESITILVTTASPLDQFLAAHPEYFFGRSPEHVLINPDNLLILLDHIRCALFEIPFQFDEGYGNLNPDQLREFFTVIQEEDSLFQSKGKYFWMADDYPAQKISLRNLNNAPINLQDSGNVYRKTIGQIDQASAYWMVHPMAIYIHEGEQYFVEDLDLEKNIASLRLSESDYYTIARTNTTVNLIEEHKHERLTYVDKAFGELQITSQVIGFHKVQWYTHQRLGTEELEMPATDLLTYGYWFSLSDKVVEYLRKSGFWTNDPNDYGPNWNSQREKARTRDHYTCKLCGIPETVRAHHVHHITPFRNFDNFQQANCIENLVTLCSTCHQRVELAVRVRSGLAGLAYVLKHLAPFFLMCDQNDIGVHSDPKSSLANGKPMIVIYDQFSAGMGFSQHLFEIHDELIKQAYELIKNCKCTDGCPSCVGPGGELGQSSKMETLAILEAILNK